jgi:protein TonB
LEADTSYKIYEYKQLNEVAKPYFADGSNMGKYIAHNLKFPDAAKEREIQGTVRLSFVVETNGNVSNIVVVNSVGGGCDNEAIRLIQETVWIPAEKNGKYVRSHNMQDITFNIGNRNFQDGNSY